MKKVEKLLNNQETNHLFPFFWQHGESNEKITEYMEKIRSTGIRSVCIESRPHPDFLGDGWWKTMDHIIEEAKRLNMKLWILDDAKFPTGYANGKVPEDLKKVYLTYHRFDFVGPKKYAEVNLKFLPEFRALLKEDHSQDKIVKAIMVKNNPSKKYGFDETSMIDVTSLIKNDILYIDLPKGYTSIYVLYYTRHGGEDGTYDYLNPMDKNATQILLNEVYQKHYDHYQDEFGKTILGFFSDEPRFGNTRRASSIGREEMVLPWLPNMLEIMEEKIDNFDPLELIFLFHGESAQAHQMRYEYMNLISDLYSQNFNQTIGKWCMEHNVDYVGHIIEDNNADARLGKGAGHFFRAMKGQSIAGIDVIGGQLVPSQPFHHDAYLTGGSEGEFFHYALCKMGASLAKLDDNKNGTLMCEAFGAYGWVEGLKLMKWITDHMLSHGVNLIVPHAFDPKDFPDWDCPPHFYAHGNNPQFPYFHLWSNYTNRMCELLSGGHQVSHIGVLYHAFSEWSGEYMFTQKVLKELLTHQVDCNVMSEDYIINCRIGNENYYVNNYAYDILVVPFSQYLPNKLLNKINDMSKKGIQVIYIDEVPLSFDKSVEAIGEVVPLDKLYKRLAQLKAQEVMLESEEKDLTYYHYHQNDGEIYMFFNESIIDEVNTIVKLNSNEELMIYDAYSNQTYHLDYTKDNNQIVFDLHLKPYESLVLLSGSSNNYRYTMGNEVMNLGNFEISLKSFNEENFSSPIEVKNLEYLGQRFSDFSGTIRYVTDFECLDTQLLLNIDEAYETIHVVINGIDCGTCITPSYSFDISKALKVGTNHLEIYVVNTLNRNQRDMMSMYIETDPLGIVGNVKLYKKEQNKNVK